MGHGRVVSGATGWSQGCAEHTFGLSWDGVIELRFDGFTATARYGFQAAYFVR